MNNSQRSVQAIVFDLDGVLIDSLAVMKQALSLALVEVYPHQTFDIDALFNEYRRFLGLGFKQIMRNLNLTEDMYEPFRKYSRAMAHEVLLYDGVKELLECCAARQLPLAIATGKDSERTLELLQSRNIGHYFSQVYASDTVAQPKPAPDMVLLFSEYTQIKPEQLLMVGDARADIQCGLAAGCQTAVARWGYGGKHEFKDLTYDYEFATLQDALSQVQHLTDMRLQQHD
ncbi:MAG: HAD-IA family hydrolase [Reinekea sp.]|jgi:3-amino-5-hydroxybenzoic acid synthesis related protein|nr:HAD-IA family hydrolase [Reinekea sp.]